MYMIIVCYSGMRIMCTYLLFVIEWCHLRCTFSLKWHKSNHACYSEGFFIFSVRVSLLVTVRDSLYVIVRESLYVIVRESLYVIVRESLYV